MANIAAAKKYIRISAKKQARNNAWRSSLENLRRKFRKAVVGNDAAQAKELFLHLQKTIDRSTRRHILHKNAAARMKSRLAARLNALSAS